MSALSEKLASEVGEAGWESLEPHYLRDALFIVDAKLDLIEVAVAVAEDRVEEVASWIEAGLLARPTVEQAKAWGEKRSLGFRFLIVQPFVLARRVSERPT